jgi:hypothetical protein
MSEANNDGLVLQQKSRKTPHFGGSNGLLLTALKNDIKK